MNEIDVIKTIAQHLSERKKSAALSNYKVLCNTIAHGNELFSSGLDAINVCKNEIEILLKADENVVIEAKDTTAAVFYFRQIAPVILANDLLVLKKFADATHSDNRNGITIESVQNLKRGFTEYNDLATTTRQFFDSLVASAYQLIVLDAKEANYQILRSLSSFYKFATKSLIQLVFEPDLEDALREFESLSKSQRRRGEESDISMSANPNFEDKLVVLFRELFLNDPILFEKVDSIYRFSSDFTHIGYVSTHLVGADASEFVFGDGCGPYLPSTENFSELKYDTLVIANRFITEIYIPSLIHFAERILVPEKITPLKERLTAAGDRISEGMSTHFQSYFFPIKDGLIGSTETIDLTCKCGLVRKWNPPHEDSERYCEKCGSSFGIIVLSGGGYIMTSDGPIRILGSTEPLISEEKRAELIAEHFPSATAEVEAWTDEQFQSLTLIERDVLSAIAHFGLNCEVDALAFLLPQYSKDDIRSTFQSLVERRFVLADNETNISIGPFLKDAAIKNFPDTDSSNPVAFYKKIADFHASKRKEDSEWRQFADIQSNVEEVRNRILSNEFVTAGKLLSEISFHYLLKWGHYSIVIDLTELIWPNLEKTDTLYPSLLMNLGLAYRDAGDLDNSVDRFEKAIEGASAQGDKGILGSIVGNLGCTQLERGRFEKARTCHFKALEVSRDLKQRRLEGDDLGNIGNVYFAEEKYPEAIDYQTQALAIAREVENRIGEGNCLLNLGFATFRNGQYLDGIKLMEDALKIFEDEEYHFGKANCLFNLGVCHVDQNSVRKATDYYEKACEAFEKSGNMGRAAILHGELGTKYLAADDNRNASEHLLKALKTFHDNGDKEKEAVTRMFLGLAYFNLESYNDSVKESLEAAAQFKMLGDEEGRGKSIGTAGGAYLHLYERRNAYRCWKEAVEILTAVGSPEAITFQKNLDLNFPKS